MKSYFEERGGSYFQVGDYQIPNLVMDDQPKGDISVWGWRRKQYLKEHRKGTYNAMLMQGTLTQHLIETNEAALDLMESLVNQMAAAKGVTVRNQIRHETDPTALAENRKQRAAITSEITALRNRVKRVKHIQKDAPRLLNLLRTEM